MRSRNSRDGGQIKTSYAHTSDQCLNITAVDVLRIAGQGAATLDRICATREDCDTIPALLPMPDNAIAGFLNSGFRKFLLTPTPLLELHSLLRSAR
jgi:hypothetical protein